MRLRSGAPEELTADDRRMLEALVGDFGPRLLAYVRQIIGYGDEAEDVVAEAFCRAAQNIATVRAVARPDLYLLTVARNLCRDNFRRRRPKAVPQEQLDRHAGRVAAPEVTSGEAERLDAVRRAVGELPEPLREIVVLRVSTGLKFEEIAELLSIPLGTALSRMHTAVEQLRDRCAGDHEYEAR